MSEVVQNWPLFDRVIFAAIVAMVFAIPFGLASITRRLDRIIRLLEIGNDKSS